MASWHLFCKVVDNFGDIGVAWRLARQLARDASRTVRLTVDDLPAFARIEARVDAARASQTVGDIAITRWDDDRWHALPDVAIELFGCGLPPRLLDAMVDAQRSGRRTPLWIDLEYLSAESWVDDFHAKPSPHPTLPLTKHFFYPGFTSRTGGVLVEPDAVATRDAFVSSRDATDAFWSRLRIPAPSADEKRLSVFAYRDGDSERRIARLVADAPEWSVVVHDATLSSAATTGRVHRIPFVAQDDYDRLLWACDANIVRGEDSFVRAQLAARPMVWHIYPQADDVHRTKLDAFATRYEAGLADEAARANRDLWHAWNGDGAALPAAWAAWRQSLPTLAAHADAWCRNLTARPTLVETLSAWVAERRGPLLN